MSTIKNIYKGLILCTSVFFLAGCSDSFLDKEPSGSISTGQLPEVTGLHPDIAENMISGIYSRSFAYSSGGTGEDHDFGQKSTDIAVDMMAGDVALSSKIYGWFSDASELACTNRTDGRTIMLWNTYYRMLYAANEVIESLGGNDVEPETDAAKYSMGQAKAIRGYCYYNLVNLFGKTYKEDKSFVCLPIYTGVTSEPAALSSVEDVYELIITDLTKAVVYLEGYERTDKVRINQDVARGLLAYAYLQTGKYKEAKETADLVLGSGKYPIMSMADIMESGFNTISIPSWMWGVDIIQANTGGLATFWGHMDIFTYSYAWAGDLKPVDSNLYARIPDTDQRKYWFYGDPSSDLYLVAYAKFYNAARNLGNPDRNWVDDIVYMRSEEMILIKAEAALRNNEPAVAKSALKTLLVERDDTVLGQIDGMSNDALLEEIYFNWRAELWGEGKALQTMKRFEKTVKRGSNHLPGFQNIDVKYNDSRLLFDIPQREQLNNPNIPQ